MCLSCEYFEEIVESKYGKCNCIENQKYFIHTLEVLSNSTCYNYIKFNLHEQYFIHRRHPRTDRLEIIS
jgi:hypothetical protein